MPELRFDAALKALLAPLEFAAGERGALAARMPQLESTVCAAAERLAALSIPTDLRRVCERVRARFFEKPHARHARARARRRAKMARAFCKTRVGRHRARAQRRKFAGRRPEARGNARASRPRANGGLVVSPAVALRRPPRAFKNRRAAKLARAQPSRARWRPRAPQLFAGAAAARCVCSKPCSTTAAASSNSSGSTLAKCSSGK